MTAEKISPFDFLDCLRPSIESQLLVEFAEVQRGERILDIGCGKGYLAYYLARKYKDCIEIVGIDIVPEVIEEAHTFLPIFREQYPDCSIPIRFLVYDAAQCQHFEQEFDVVISNPPFFDRRKSRLSPHSNRKYARQDAVLPLDALLAFAHLHLHPNGRMYLVFPANRFDELIEKAKRVGFDKQKGIQREDIRKSSGGIWLIELRKTRSI